MTSSHILLIAACVAVLGLGCRASQPANDPDGARHCVSRGEEDLWAGGQKRSSRGAEWAASNLPELVSMLDGRIEYVDTLDLNCDGVSDAVVQLLSATEGLVIVAVIRAGSEWHTVLRSPSPVSGPEIVFAAADATNDGWLDLLLLGSDEGGHVPRIFASHDGRYREVPVPVDYLLRHEPDWDERCRREIRPRIDGGRILLPRETIPRTSARSHGHECALPVDTLRIAGDSLVISQLDDGSEE